MPADLTIFAAQYLVYIEAMVTFAAVAFVLRRQPPLEILRWVLVVGLTGVVAEVFAQIGGALFVDPRPFAAGHYHPLVAHIADNGFPSDHGLLAAFLVACVIVVRFWIALLLVALLGALIDWARVGAGIHHPIDVIGSAVFILLGLIIALGLTPFIFGMIVPHLPRSLSRPERIST